MKVGVIGAGALGTAICQNISNNLPDVLLYARREKVVNDINNFNCNKDYFPKIKLNNNIIATSDLSDFSDVDAVILTIPSSNLREIMGKLSLILSEDCIIITTIKGIEKSSSKTASEVIKEFVDNKVFVFSGPTIARELVLNLPFATTIAIDCEEDMKLIREIFESEVFKLQFNFDRVGTELCGILKNILAISFGICEGLNVNDSAKFAILNKGFVEVGNILECLGGKRETILDYCGFGDIVTASTLSVSRNHTLGVLYGQKIVIDENETGVVFEGKNSIITIKKLCDEKNIDSIIVNFVNDVIIEKINPELAFENLWSEF